MTQRTKTQAHAHLERWCLMFGIGALSTIQLHGHSRALSSDSVTKKHRSILQQPTQILELGAKERKRKKEKKREGKKERLFQRCT